VRHTYYLSLGSNVGDREGTLRRGWALMARHLERGRLSSLYETQPMYITAQPPFLNAAAEAISTLAPAEMLRVLHAIESRLGRERATERRMGPRTLDLDILLCDDLVLEEPDLHIPHPRLSERLFALVPLLELVPWLRDPRSGAPFASAAAALSASGAGGVYYYHPR
jgi:2-amino-4-hydroxy-6-hydroxymethyldihydropteridine diphosphokinase